MLLYYGSRALFYGWIVAMAAVFVVLGVRRMDRSVARGLFWWNIAACGVYFGVLATINALMPEAKFGNELIRQQAIRFGILATGTTFILAHVAAALPLLLNLLERVGFVPFVAARHFRAGKSGVLKAVTVLSIMGVAFSSCALCEVTSIMGGFGHDLKRKILGNTAHVVVDLPGPGGFDDWQHKLAEIRTAIEPFGGKATPVVGGDAMASSSTNTAGTLVRAIDPDTIGQVIDLKQNIEVGKFEWLLEPEKLTKLEPGTVIGRGSDGQPYYQGPGYQYPYPDKIDPDLLAALQPSKKVHPGVILGRELAKSLHVMVGDEVTMLSPMGELGPTGIMPRARKFRVAAIFYSGMYEYDASHAYVLLGRGQNFFSMEELITNIDIRIPEPERVAEVRPAVDQTVARLNEARQGGSEAPEATKPLRVRDWQEMNKNLFSALKLEKIATFIILSIAIAVASFCIICTLLLMVTEKSKEIAVVKSLGASDRSVLATFMLEGVLIGAVGTIFGVVCALATCLGLSWTGFRLDPDVYYIDRLPVNVDGGDYTLVALAALAICTIATIYPARTASLVQPVDGLRYE